MRARVAFLAWALLVLGSSHAGGQEITRPNLAGHTFLPSDVVPDAFVRTYIRNTLGVAEAANLEYPTLIVGGDTLLSLDGSLAYATLGFEYQHAVKDWIAVRIEVEGRTRLGTELSSILIDGVTVNAAYDVSWLVRVHESDRTMLSGALGLTRQTFTRIDLKQFVEDVIDGVPNPKLISDVPALRSFGGARFAWAISRPFGLSAHLNGSYGETPWRDESDGWAYDYGLAVDFDMNPPWRVPLGVAVAYKQQSSPLLTSEKTGAGRTGVMRIAYNAKPDFIVGFDLTRTWNRTEVRDKQLASSGVALTLRYYF